MSGGVWDVVAELHDSEAAGAMLEREVARMHEAADQEARIAALLHAGGYDEHARDRANRAVMLAALATASLAVYHVFVFHPTA